jgi:hypothetical protein
VITALTPMPLRTQGGMIKLPPPAAPEAEKPAAASVEVDAAALKKSTVVQLKKKLKGLGLDTTGKKVVLIKRLVEALSAPPPAKGAAKPAVESVNLNLGIYGVPAAVKRSPAGLFPMATRVRRLEAWLRDNGGFQHTYCDSFQTEEEFEQMFDHAQYDKMRARYGADAAFPRVYAKTRPEVAVFEWLREEEAAAR